MNTNHISVSLNYVKSVELLTEFILKRISLLLNFSWMTYKHVTLFSKITHFVYANEYHMTADAARLFLSLLFVVWEGKNYTIYIFYRFHLISLPRLQTGVFVGDYECFHSFDTRALYFMVYVQRILYIMITFCYVRNFFTVFIAHCELCYVIMKILIFFIGLITRGCLHKESFNYGIQNYVKRVDLKLFDILKYFVILENVG